MVCDSIAFLVFTLITAAIATSETNPTVSWTDCGAPHGKIKMTAFLEEQRHAEARKHCQNLNGDLATVQSTLERNCANAALNNVRTCTCCNSRGYYQCARVSGTGSCGCAAWVGLTGTNFSNGKFKSWTWYTPSSNTRSSSIAWIRSFPRQKRARYRVFYHPELGGFFNVHDSPRPYLCQQYYPPAPLNISLIYTGVNVLLVSTVLHPATYLSNISEYCFTYGPAFTADTIHKVYGANRACGAVNFTSLNCTSNTLYNISAYVKTVAGLRSSASGWSTFATRPESPLGVIIYKIADTFVQLKANVTVLGNLPIVQYIFKFGNKEKLSELYTSPFQQSIYMFTNLTADTSYSVSTSIRNKYAWSMLSQSTSITTLPAAPSNLTVTSTDTEISVSVEDTYSSAISKYCFILNATMSLYKNTICDAKQNVKFIGLASNMLYNVSAFVVTVDGRNSTASNVVSIATKPSVFIATTGVSQGDMSSVIVVTKDRRTSTVSTTLSISTNTKATPTGGSQDILTSATVVTKDPHKSPIHTAVQAITNQSDSNIDTESGSQDNTSSFGLAAIVASSGAAGLLVLVIAIILIWKFKMGPRKQGGDLNLRDQSVSNHNPLDPVQDTPISMDANEAYGTCVLAKNDAYGCVELRGNEEHGNGSGAGGGLESEGEAEDHYTSIDHQ
eukprot:scpid58455/ scgid6341/ 